MSRFGIAVVVILAALAGGGIVGLIASRKSASAKPPVEVAPAPAAPVPAQVAPAQQGPVKAGQATVEHATAFSRAITQGRVNDGAHASAELVWADAQERHRRAQEETTARLKGIIADMAKDAKPPLDPACFAGAVNQQQGQKCRDEHKLWGLGGQDGRTLERVP